MEVHKPSLSAAHEAPKRCRTTTDDKMLAHLTTTTVLMAALMAADAAAQPIERRGCAKPLKSRGASSKRGFSWPGQEGQQGHFAGQLTQDGTMTWFWNWGLWKTDIPQAPEFVGQL